MTSSNAPPAVAPERFSSWAEVCAAAASYTEEKLNAFKVARAALRSVDGTTLRSSVLHLPALALPSDQSITDFGGSTGDLGVEFLRAFPKASYTVVENPTMAAMMRGKSAVRFQTEAPTECDVFFSSGILQYLDEPLEILSKGFVSARLPLSWRATLSMTIRRLRSPANLPGTDR